MNAHTYHEQHQEIQRCAEALTAIVSRLDRDQAREPDTQAREDLRQSSNMLAVLARQLREFGDTHRECYPGETKNNSPITIEWAESGKPFWAGAKEAAV